MFDMTSPEKKAETFLRNVERIFETVANSPPHLNKNLDDVFNYLKKCPDVLMLIELSLQNTMLKNFCRRDEMESYWNEVWKHMGKNPTYPESVKNPNVIYQPLLPQKKILTYDLVCGMSLYNKVYQLPSEQHINQLRAAADLHNFAALESLSYLYGKSLAAGQWIEPVIALEPFIRSAKKQGSPAFILCAKMCINYAQYYFSNHQLQKYQEMLLESLNYLFAAKILEPHCQHEIHNAYYGKDEFSQILKNNFSKININNPGLRDAAKSIGHEFAVQWIESSDSFSRLVLH